MGPSAGGAATCLAGNTSDGYTLLIEREAGGHWVATVASASRSRNISLEAAILEAAGSSAPKAWTAALAATLTGDPTDADGTGAVHNS